MKFWDLWRQAKVSSVPERGQILGVKLLGGNLCTGLEQRPPSYRHGDVESIPGSLLLLYFSAF